MALAVPCLVLLATQTEAACETRAELDYRVAESPCASGSLGDGEPARIANIGAGRWRNWTWDAVERVVEDGGTRTGSQEMAGSGLVLRGAFPRRVDRYELGDSLSDVHPYPRTAPPERFSLRSVLRYATEVLTLTDGSGGESESPSYNLQHGSTDQPSGRLRSRSIASRAVTIGIPSMSPRASTSPLSPDTTRSAWPATAAAGIGLSFGSRDAVTSGSSSATIPTALR